ncbi:glycoside hydrolase domain-containing protein [Geobacter hydrogenophilus]|uniref:glycoside hydrolase domain-containing protein n=1 Tax=Geobacter hydrogenophilus TaxID=40983 RepID=UPI001FE530F8|nr:glycoside hydrolase domain-containing protein [Geobacter hydrogenophilus]
MSEVVREDAKSTTLHVRRAPRLIEPGTVTVGKDETRGFWLTLAVPVDAVPGTYQGAFEVRTKSGGLLTLPVMVEVLPFTLPEPDIRFGMMMDYAFYELDNPGWSAEEKRILAKRGEEIYRDFRTHGMNVAYPHSHFFYRTDDKGRPVLEGLKAALESYRSQGFSGPFVWYLGHLLHTAKPQHPGSILLYDEAVAVRRLRALLSELERLCREKGVAKERVLIQVVDEPDRRDKMRTKVGETLNGIVREMGFRTLITRPWPKMDVICTGDPDNDAEADRLRKTAHEWWIYPNGALTGQNLSYTRYVFGFGAWRWGVNGVVPWTYQMSQGSNGNPFTVLDGPEVMVAYPGAAGPLSTPVWETIRDGINDYRYIQTLRGLIARAKSRGDGRGVRVERELERLKKSLGAGPTEAEGNYGAWPPGSFDEVRGRIIALIRELR